MVFLNPSILFGLLAASIPILIHIINLRKLQRIEFSTLSFLKELQKSICFCGAVDFDRVLDYYEKFNVLVLVSKTEGWPKAIAEAMAFGLICIGSDQGLIPWMLGEGRGIVVPPGNVDALADELQKIAVRPHDYDAMSWKAAQWGQQYSLDDLKSALKKLFDEYWV